MENNFFFVFLMACIGCIDGKTEDDEHVRVIIVGAGISGYGAACRLLENNFTDLRILEASDRIGGRIKSVYLGENFIDLGAEYIHGEQGNLVSELYKKYMPLPQEEYISTLYYSNGEKVDDFMMIDFFKEFYELAKNPGAPNVSLYETFVPRYRSNILSKYEKDKKIHHIAEEFMNTIEIIFLSMEGSFDWHSPRSKFHNFRICPGHEMQSWYGKGFKTIFDILKKNIGEDNAKKLDVRINLKKTVKIVDRKDKIIQVECSDGTKMTSDHVIFTAPLGVLKHEYKEMFHPGLDEEKVGAIDALGIDGIMKIGLEFSKSWWKNPVDSYLVWSDEDGKKLFKDVPFGPTKDGRHWLSYVNCISPASNNSRVAIAWMGGHLVPEAEQLSDQQLKEGIMYVIKKFFGKTHDLTEPISIVHSKWCTDPHFRGSFSYEPIDVYKLKNSPHEDLLKPVLDEAGVPRIFFAGEATHPTRFSASDGALSSGFMQADKLLKYFKENK